MIFGKSIELLGSAKDGVINELDNQFVRAGVTVADVAANIGVESKMLLAGVFAKSIVDFIPLEGMGIDPIVAEAIRLKGDALGDILITSAAASVGIKTVQAYEKSIIVEQMSAEEITQLLVEKKNAKIERIMKEDEENNTKGIQAKKDVNVIELIQNGEVMKELNKLGLTIGKVQNAGEIKPSEA